MTSMINEKFLLVVLMTISVLHTLEMRGQEEQLGLPMIMNYTPDWYAAGPRNWKIISAHDRLYCANDAGLLEFNGRKWHLYPLPRRSVVRSVCADDNGRIYVGGQDEIGYFDATENGSLQYHSLLEHIPDDQRNLEDVWDLVRYKDNIVARSVNKLFFFRGDTVEVFDPSEIISFVSAEKGQLYFNVQNEGIFQLNADGMSFVDGSGIFAGILVEDVVDFNGTLLVITGDKGIYSQKDNQFIPWNRTLNAFLEKHGINAVSIIDSSRLAIGTFFSGVVIVQTNGDPVYLLDKSSGMQNANVTALFTDKYKNLWVGTNNGIDHVGLERNIKQVLPDGELEGAVYDVAVHNGKIYFGTNNGLYARDLNEKDHLVPTSEFSLIENSSGQVWGLDTIGGQLFMGHNEGAFIIENGRAQRLSTIPGYWRFIGFQNNTHMIGGCYQGLSLFKKTGGEWRFVKILDGFKESSRLLVKDDENRLWLSHPYRGIYRIEFDEEFSNLEVEKYNTSAGLPSSLRNGVFKIRDQIVFSSKNRMYKFEESANRFVVDTTFSESLDAKGEILRVFADDYQRIWFITDDDFGYLNISEDLMGKSVQKISYPEYSNQFITNFENIHILSENAILIHTNRGSVVYNEIGKSKRSEVDAGISEVRLLADTDSIIYGGFPNRHFLLNGSDDDIEINHKPKRNQIRFEFFSSAFDHYEDIEFNPYLEDVDGSDKIWSRVDFKEYNNLGPGEYRFSVRARRKNGHVSPPAMFKFTIAAPWYASKLAFGFYALLLSSIVLGLIFIPRSRYKKKAKVLKDAHNQSKLEISTLRNEKLESDLNFKNQQLALSTMHIVQKNEVLNKVKQEINTLQKVINNPVAETELKKLISLLSNDDRLDDDWESFAYHFDQVHTDFLRRLKEKYPNLSPKDQKLCAYLRMNLSTKEISPLLNISIRGVEISRYRLRKKLQLDSSVNLNDFMMNF